MTLKLENCLFNNLIENNEFINDNRIKIFHTINFSNCILQLCFVKSDNYINNVSKEFQSKIEYDILVLDLIFPNSTHIRLGLKWNDYHKIKNINKPYLFVASNNTSIVYKNNNIIIHNIDELIGMNTIIKLDESKEQIDYELDRYYNYLKNNKMRNLSKQFMENNNELYEK